ncbi:hypothetical protein AB0469_17985 [Streptomyces sp. NPDC093801]|uniref:hypothetical protein n=1 Tax=Streptomyces sp. NPDC093801 TaxID=3155203 RepID=UPI00344DFDAD
MRKRTAAALGGAALLATTLLGGTASAAPAGATWLCGDAWLSSRAEGHAWIRYCEDKNVIVATVTDDKADGRCPRVSGYLYHNKYYVHSPSIGPKGASRDIVIYAPDGDFFYTAGVSWVSC